MSTELVKRLESKDDFKKCREEYKDRSGACWEMHMWDFFRSKTCYIPTRDCFISLDKAIELKILNIKK